MCIWLHVHTQFVIKVELSYNTYHDGTKNMCGLHFSKTNGLLNQCCSTGSYRDYVISTTGGISVMDHALPGNNHFHRHVILRFLFIASFYPMKVQ